MRLLFLRIQKLLDEVNMKGNLLKVSILALGLSAFLTVGARHAAAQGPAGAGARADVRCRWPRQNATFKNPLPRTC